MPQNKVTASQVVTSTNSISPRARIRPVASEPAKPAPPMQPRKSRRLAFKKADVTRAVLAVAKAGIVPGSIELTTDGTIRIYVAGAEPTDSLFDQWADKL
jgi:hypothetical protein